MITFLEPRIERNPEPYITNDELRGLLIAMFNREFSGIPSTEIPVAEAALQAKAQLLLNIGAIWNIPTIKIVWSNHYCDLLVE